MAEDTATTIDTAANGTLMWHNVEINPDRVRLFRAWAKQREQTDADLASDIFAAGTAVLCCETTGEALLNPGTLADRDVVGDLLDHLAVHLGVSVDE